MSPKPPAVNLENSEDSDARPTEAPSDDVGADVEAGAHDDSVAVALEEAKPVAESYDDSLEAILLQAGARPPASAASKQLVGSKTLMGIGLDGLNLPALRAGAPATMDAAARTTAGGDVAVAELPLPPGLPSDDKPVTSLLDDVAEALNVQASEYRDRARGRLPGMPGASKPADTPLRAASSDLQAEFEDPDDGDTALTPGVNSVIDEHDEAGEFQLEAQLHTGDQKSADPDDAVVLASAGLSGSPKSSKSGKVKEGPKEGGEGGKGGKGGKEGRSGPVPPPPGLSLGVAAPSVGPPPGAAVRGMTPSAGLPPTGSGRTRLPTPLAGAPRVLPPPPSSRLTLPIGTMAPALAHSIVDLTATAPATPISLEASRRISAGLASSSGSGRVSARGHAQVTEPVMYPPSRSSTTSGLPVVLAAQVKIATVSLAGLIALTFAGGLFVGMLVWRGQGRVESGAIARTAPVVAPTSSAAGPATPAASAGAANSPARSPAPTGAGGPALNATVSGGSEAAGAATAEPVVAPIATDVEATEAGDTAKQPARRPAPVVRAAAPRPRRPTTPPPPGGEVAVPADTKGVAVKAAAPRPAAPAASKAVAANASAKPAAKSKPKSTWHDPFAD